MRQALSVSDLSYFNMDIQCKWFFGNRVMPKESKQKGKPTSLLFLLSQSMTLQTFVYPSPELVGDFPKPGARLGACQKACLGNLDSGLSRGCLRARRPKLREFCAVTACPGEKAVAPSSQETLMSSEYQASVVLIEITALW